MLRAVTPRQIELAVLLCEVDSATFVTRGGIHGGCSHLIEQCIANIAAGNIDHG